MNDIFLHDPLAKQPWYGKFPGVPLRTPSQTPTGVLYGVCALCTGVLTFVYDRSGSTTKQLVGQGQGWDALTTRRTAT